jgi:hypothetical protein
MSSGAFWIGGNVLAAMVEAHVLVVHGGGAAAVAVFVGLVHALVGLGGFADEVGVGGHVFSYTPVVSRKV